MTAVTDRGGGHFETSSQIIRLAMLLVAKPVGLLKVVRKLSRNASRTLQPRLVQTCFNKLPRKMRLQLPWGFGNCRRLGIRTSPSSEGTPCITSPQRTTGFRPSFRMASVQVFVAIVIIQGLKKLPSWKLAALR